MMENTLALADQSSVKEKGHGKTYRIPVSTGIFEHCPDMLDAIWLFLWYIDKTTKESDGKGCVLGGMPISDSKPAGALGVPVKTSRRWRLHLEAKGYIRARRTPYGYVITLLKSKKWNLGPSPVVGPNNLRDLPNGEISPRDFPLQEERFPVSGGENSPSGKCKEDKTGQYRDIAEEETASASFLKERIKSKKNHPAWAKIKIQPCGSTAFCQIWERTWDDSEVGEPVVDIMEQAIQLCQYQGIKVPPPFYAAKRAVEDRDREAQGEENELSKMPQGDRGIPEECQR